MSMTLEEVVQRLNSMANPEHASGMARFGIETGQSLGIRAPQLWSLAKEIGRDHALALALWNRGVQEARVVACMVDDPKQVTEAQMESWVKDIDSWNVCDCAGSALFDKTPFAYGKAAEWSARPEEFVKRAAFVLMASLAVHDKAAADDAFLEFLPVIVREAADDRNFVKKAVNWALRQIGKRNLALNAAAIEAAHAVRDVNTRSARWIASDALRELTNEKVQARLAQRRERAGAPSVR